MGTRPAASRHRILIVDDEPAIAGTLAWIFAAKGYEARSALSAEEALEIIEGWVPEIALLDVCLPGMSGVDLAIRMKAQCPQCSLLLISGQPESGDVLRDAGERGAGLELLAKPMPPAALLERAGELLR